MKDKKKISRGLRWRWRTAEEQEQAREEIKKQNSFIINMLKVNPKDVYGAEPVPIDLKCPKGEAVHKRLWKMFFGDENS